MNPEIKERWVAALRSGEYAQTMGFLHDKEGFCCLGVLCEIAVADGVIEKWEPNPNTFTTAIRPDEKLIMFYGRRGSDDLDEASQTSLPTLVIEWAGLSSSNPEVFSPEVLEYEDFRAEDYGQTDLASLNDDDQLTFEEIADVIEKQL